MQGRPPDAGRLQDQAGAVAPAHPRRLGAVGRPPAEPAVDDRRHVVLESREVAVGIQPRAGLEGGNADAALRELPGDDRSSAAGLDDDDVDHAGSSR